MTSIEEKSKLKRGRKKEEFYVGEGITIKPTERYCKFGTLLLHKPMLNRYNRLSVKFPCLACVKEFPSQVISDDFASLIRDILNGTPLNQKKLNELSNREKMLFYNLCKRAKIDEQLGLFNYKEEESNKDMDRFELVRGMVLAGNNSPEILKELRTLILKFMSNGTMAKSQGNQLLLEINSVMKI